MEGIPGIMYEKRSAAGLLRLINFLGFMTLVGFAVPVSLGIVLCFYQESFIVDRHSMIV